jgi:D-3-phosphoglycerate dehydrogenase
VDTDALVEALQNGQIAGAGLDVLEDEKVISEREHPLRKLDNVILTPHSAWYSDAAVRKLQRKAAEAMACALRGEKPPSILNPQVWEKRRK